MGLFDHVDETRLKDESMAAQAIADRLARQCEERARLIEKQYADFLRDDVPVILADFVAKAAAIRPPSQLVEKGWSEDGISEKTIIYAGPLVWKAFLSYGEHSSGNDPIEPQVMVYVDEDGRAYLANSKEKFSLWSRIHGIHQVKRRVYLLEPLTNDQIGNLFAFSHSKEIGGLESFDRDDVMTGVIANMSARLHEIL